MQVKQNIQSGQNKFTLNNDLSNVNLSDLTVKVTHQKTNIKLSFDVTDIIIPENSKPCPSKQMPDCNFNHCILFDLNCQLKGIYNLQICLLDEIICDIYVNVI